MGMCLAWGVVGGEWIRRLGLGFTNHVRVERVCLFGLRWYRWGVGSGLGPGS